MTEDPIQSILRIARQIEDHERQALAAVKGRKPEPMPPHYLAVYNYIVEYKQAHDGLSPTMRQIMAVMPGVCKSTSYTQWVLDRLESEGYIKRERGGARSITVIGGRWIPPGG